MTFEELKIGQAFIYHDTPYLKIKFSGEDLYAVNLELGLVRVFPKAEPVIPTEIEIKEI